MNAPRIREELLAIRTRVDALLTEVASEEASAKPLPRVMKPKQYAEHRGVGLRTVYTWIRLGLPTERRGRIQRVVVREADAWDEKIAIARSAELEASGGKA